MNDLLEVRSHLFVLTKNRLETLRMRLGLSPAYFPPVFRRDESDARRWQLTAEICRDIAALADSSGAEALFVIIPASYQVDRDFFAEYLRIFEIDPASVDIDQPNRLLGRALRAQGLTVIDPLEDFRMAHAAGARLYGSVDKHLSPAGHRLLASIVVPRAVRQLREAHRRRKASSGATP